MVNIGLIIKCVLSPYFGLTGVVVMKIISVCAGNPHYN